MSRPSFGKSISIDLDSAQPHKLGLPMFSYSCVDGSSEARIHMGHYNRMKAVVEAARSGNPLLLKLALAHHDEHGSNA